MNGVSAPGDAALSGDKKSSGRMSFFIFVYSRGSIRNTNQPKRN